MSAGCTFVAVSKTKKTLFVPMPLERLQAIAHTKRLFQLPVETETNVPEF